MGGEGDSNHLVSGGDLEGDSDFTQPSLVVDCDSPKERISITHRSNRAASVQARRGLVE